MFSVRPFITRYVIVPLVISGYGIVSGILLATQYDDPLTYAVVALMLGAYVWTLLVFRMMGLRYLSADGTHPFGPDAPASALERPFWGLARRWSVIMECSLSDWMVRFHGWLCRGSLGWLTIACFAIGYIAALTGFDGLCGFLLSGTIGMAGYVAFCDGRSEIRDDGSRQDTSNRRLCPRSRPA